MDEYKEYDLLPCPWCNNPVHVAGGSGYGYYITCGRYACNCRFAIIYDTEQEAREEWNNGTTFKKINDYYNEEAD